MWQAGGSLLLAKGTYRLLAQPKGRAYSSYFVAGAKDLRGPVNGLTGYGREHKKIGRFMLSRYKNTYTEKFNF